MKEKNKIIEEKKFRHLSPEERIEKLKEFSGLSEEEVALLSGKTHIPIDVAENLIENVIGYFPMPFGVANYFRIDNKDYFIPMVVEETSIIASASATAKWVRNKGFIRTQTLGNLIIGQIQLPRVRDVFRAQKILHENRSLLIEQANYCLPGLVKRGGGVKDITFRNLEREDSDLRMLVIHVLCDPKDAMGANIINQICEYLKPKIEELTSEKVGLCILSNLVDGKLVTAEIVMSDIDVSVGEGIAEASLFAKTDPYRATTHNKGVLNGMDALLIATGNDWRAVEAGVHSYAATTGKYQPVTSWEMHGTDLTGKIEVPLALGIVGGVTKIHPFAKIALKILGVKTADELAKIVAAVGLVQNLGALKALATTGIVMGHMLLHARNLALAAGAVGDEIEQVREPLCKFLEEGKVINISRAKEVLGLVRANGLRKNYNVRPGVS